MLPYLNVMQVNNEIGTIQPVACGWPKRAHNAGALFLCDAVQAAGKLDLPEQADLIAITAHKLYGPKGIGALWVRDGVKIGELIHGGGQDPFGVGCSTCHVIIDKLWFDKLPRASEDEEDMLDLASGARRTSRLSCQIDLTAELDGLVVHIPTESRNMQGV
jgi:selenocysteine lyase/cysteine desulfurase